MTDPLRMDAWDLCDAMRRGALDPVETAEFFCERVETYDRRIHAFLWFDREDVLRRARLLREKVSGGGTPGPLFGLPVAVKDNICVAGTPTTAGSRILEGWRAPYDATVVKRLRDADAVPFGKTNLDEFGMGSSCEYSAFGPTRNPYDAERVPGGSGGGSAAAVAARLTPAALGSDTGGSVRQPAAFCGVTGHRPTYGVVSRRGLIAFASSLDQIGPVAPSARDCALLLDAVAGADDGDATTSDRWSGATAALRRRIKDGRLEGFRTGLIRGALEASDEGVQAAVEEALRVLEKAGAEVDDVEAPILLDAVPVYQVLAAAEAGSNLARYRGVHFGPRGGAANTAEEAIRATRALFGAEVRRRVLLGAFVLSSGHYDAYYANAMRCRAAVRDALLSALDGRDALVLPTSPTAAFRFGERTTDPLSMYEADVMTAGASLAGLPAVSVPCGFCGGLPVGLQILGRPFEDVNVLVAASVYQMETDWHMRPPERLSDFRAEEEK